MRFQLSIIIIVFMLCVIATQSTSKYEGVSWNEKRNLWQTKFDVNGKVKTFYFDNEFDAADKLNQLCDKMGILPQNPEICELSNQQESKKTSQYKGVFWHRERSTWYVLVHQKGQKQKYGGIFKDELDAAKRANQLCEELRIPLQNPEISVITNQKYQKNENTSRYKGVTWHRERGKWQSQLQLKGQKPKYGGMFEHELDAVKRVNQLCEELGIPTQHPDISATPNQPYRKKEIASKYIGVTWNTQTRKWRVQLCLKGEKPKYGGYFKNELDAAKKTNQLCEELGIPLQNPEISAVPNQEYQHLKVCGIFQDEQDAAKKVNQLCEELEPNQQYQKKEKPSQYKGVFWHRASGNWIAQLQVNGKKVYGGYVKDELDAAKRVNQLCEELGIPLQNPEISALSIQQYQKKDKTSQYKGICWNKQTRKWRVQLSCKREGKSRCAGYFKNELDAAKRLNQLCQELEIPLRNPEISAKPNQNYQKNCKTLLDYDAIKAEFQDLVKIIDQNSDPTTHIITENLNTATNYGEKSILTDINLQTDNGESALSIAAKHGFSNIVKFLISKGAQKDHFTNQYHTPLSLAVSQNHLKVVQVLFEDWISPNSHEKPYLHLAPIFQVKSREIAQLLIENDAVTHEIYNDKNQSPLTVACKNGYLDVVECFLDDGLYMNHLDSNNKTPLFYALTNKHHDVVKLLISKGAHK